ncbi:MAG TPA: PaaI family thioesterase [Polyangiaceae bacterium]|nr:PaaI family thioesterase [Polyangiaceae bacterium]
MIPVADAIRAAKEGGDVAALVEAIPYLRLLGISVTAASGELIGKMAYSDPLIGNASLPALHGGAIGALLESTAIMAALWESETVVLPKIVTITIDFLRSGRPVDTFACGVITKGGRRVVNVGVEAWQEDRARPIARAHAIFLVQPADDPAG